MLTPQQLRELETVMDEDDRNAPEPTPAQLSRLAALLAPHVPRPRASCE